MDWFNKKKNETHQHREMMRDRKLIESRAALLKAAISTTTAARLVALSLQARLDDSEVQIEKTASIMNDALIICDYNTGKIQAFNPAAEFMFGRSFNEVKDMSIGKLISYNAISVSSLWTLLDSGFLKGIQKDGSVFALDINHASLTRSDGSSIVLLILRTGIDISGIHRSFSEDGIFVMKDNKIVAANANNYKIEDMMTTIEDMEQEDAKDVFKTIKIFRGGNASKFFLCLNKIWWHGGPACLITVKELLCSNKIFNEELKILDNDINELETNLK